MAFRIHKYDSVVVRDNERYTEQYGEGMIVDEYIRSVDRDSARRWISLRALEWMNLVLFAGQPLVPLFLLFGAWWIVILSVYLLNIAWMAFRYRFYSLDLSILAVILARFRWISAIGGGMILFVQGHYPIAFLAALWPLLCAIIVLPGKLNRVEMMIGKTLEHRLGDRGRGLSMLGINSSEELSQEELIAARMPARHTRKAIAELQQ